MIKNIVFDISGVLADFRMKEFLVEKGFDPLTIKRIIKASVFSPFWGMFERGEISEEEALLGFTTVDPGIEAELRTAYTNITGMLTARDFAIPLIRELKGRGFRTYYLSNYSEKAYNECGESLSFMEYMDGGLVSFKVGKTKPDPNFFKAFLEKYDLPASECIFVDDTEENVVAAKKLGFHGIVFSSYEQLMPEILKIESDNGNNMDRAAEIRRSIDEHTEERAKIVQQMLEEKKSPSLIKSIMDRLSGE